MENGIKFVGLDVHQDTIAVAVAEVDGELRTLGTIHNEPDDIAKLMRRLGPAERVFCCYHSLEEILDTAEIAIERVHSQPASRWPSFAIAVFSWDGLSLY